MLENNFDKMLRQYESPVTIIQQAEHWHKEVSA